ncbi:MAG: Thiamine monophosphate kinase ThiL [Candidatus Methanohalarchaeum thermophilum]|uniref:Thiamine-monophosphate kinase n=1 Tax=Methanohalarchaeum thermophilum TaxID=1903181 RepID=A0A1Q6DXG2_METT1|nr:MAG: Thiamine monophosphate kinase ThiL [Candidatus Methanohalarchaeum thermophilum]
MRKLSDIGEFGLVDIISEEFEECGGSITRLGEDDCAVLKLNGDYLAITSDLLTRRTHLPDFMSFEDIGWRSVAVNLSDLASVGCKPLWFNLSMALPDLKEREFKNLIRGVRTCLDKYDTCYIGGDLSEGSQIFLSGTAVGRNLYKNPLLRSGSKVGDFVCLTNEIGFSGVCLEYMKNNITLEDEEKQKVFEEFSRPQPRLEQGIEISRDGGHSAIDLSDGLVFSLHQLAEAGDVGFEISMNKIPINRRVLEISERENLDLMSLLRSGEEYELLFTTSNEDLIDKIEAKVIGRVVEEPNVYLDGKKIKKAGFTHF